MTGNTLMTAAAAALAGSLLAAGTAGAHGGEFHAAEGLTTSSGAGLAAVAIAFGALYWLANRHERRSATPVNRIEPGKANRPNTEIDRPIPVPDIKQTYLLRASPQPPDRP